MNEGAAMAAESPSEAISLKWLSVCRLEDIPVMGSRRVARERGLPVALFRTADDQVHALLDRCPHKGGPLSQGIVLAQAVACPLHNWNIQFADGCARAPDVGSTPTFTVQLLDGRVHLRADELATKGIDLSAPIAGPCRGRHG
jgi:nitrite reductase (NADH) small subunit